MFLVQVLAKFDKNKVQLSLSLFAKFISETKASRLQPQLQLIIGSIKRYSISLAPAPQQLPSLTELCQLTL